MEYLYFSVMVVSLGAVLAVWAVRTARPGNPRAGRSNGDRGAKSAADGQDIRFEPGTGNTARAHTPWGWPGGMTAHSGEGAAADDRGIGDRLGDWVGAIVQQKRTVDDEDYRVRTHESLRALVEDRYARPSTARTNPRRGRDGAARPGLPGVQRTDPVRTPWGW